MSERSHIGTAVQPIGMWAVARHHAKLKAARFASLHYTEQSAISEAERLAASTFAEHGAETGPFCFYVIKIVGRVGLIDGRLLSEKL